MFLRIRAQVRITSCSLVMTTSLLVLVEPSATPYLFTNYIPNFSSAPEYQVLHQHVGSMMEHFYTILF